jgi:hypothetical protein
MKYMAKAYLRPNGIAPIKKKSIKRRVALRKVAFVVSLLMNIGLLVHFYKVI